MGIDQQNLNIWQKQISMPMAGSILQIL
jgi:hypothetical protein